MAKRYGRKAGTPPVDIVRGLKAARMFASNAHVADRYVVWRDEGCRSLAFLQNAKRKLTARFGSTLTALAHAVPTICTVRCIDLRRVVRMIELRRNLAELGFY